MNLSLSAMHRLQTYSCILPAQQVSSVVIWNPVQQKWSNSISLFTAPMDRSECGLNSPWQNIWTLVQVIMEESKIPKWTAPAANHVQQPWNVYSQAYMKAARNSIVTPIGTGKAFSAFVSLMRWQNDTEETPTTVRDIIFSKLITKTNNPWLINAELKLGSETATWVIDVSLL